MGVYYVKLNSLCCPCRGFLVILDTFSHRFRGGLRCVVPLGFPEYRMDVHYQVFLLRELIGAARLARVLC